MTNQIVRDVTLLDRYQAGQLLKRLVDEGHLEQHGHRRGTTYRMP